MNMHVIICDLFVIERLEIGRFGTRSPISQSQISKGKLLNCYQVESRIIPHLSIIRNYSARNSVFPVQ